MREWSKSLQKYIRSLYLPKFRKKYGKFLAEGDKICSEIIANSNFEIEYIVATQSWISDNKDKNLAQDKLVRIEEKDLIAISNQSSGIQVLIVANKKPETINIPLIKQGFALFLDDVQDPGNLGSILRIADWFDLSAVIRSKSSADFYNPKVIQSSMGSFLRVPMFTVDFDDLHDQMPEHLFYGTDMSGDDIFQNTEFAPGVIVIGNEGKGMSSNDKSFDYSY